MSKINYKDVSNELLDMLTDAMEDIYAIKRDLSDISDILCDKEFEGKEKVMTTLLLIEMLY